MQSNFKGRAAPDTYVYPAAGFGFKNEESFMGETNGTCVRVLLADHSEVMRKAVCNVLGMEPSIKLVGEAVNFKQTLNSTKALKPDVLLLDLHMPDGQAFRPEFIKFCLNNAGVKVLAMSLLSGEADEQCQKLADSLGAVMLLDKTKFGSQLIPTILSLNQPQAA